MQRRFRIRKFTWPVHWQGYLDYQRHQDRLEQALRKGEESSVCREVLTVREEGKTTRIALQFLRQYGFEFDRGTVVSIGHLAQDLSPLSGTGQGPGQVLGQVPGQGSEEGSGQGFEGVPGEASEEGIKDFVSSPFFGSGTDLTVASYVYKDWVLPGLALPEEKQMALGNARTEIPGPLDIKRTLLANLVRNSLRGQKEIANINYQDLRYRFPIPEPEAEKIPVVFLLRDVSSSMGEKEKSLSRWGFGLISAFLEEVYPEALSVFIIHHVAAREVSQEEFFAVHRCGGTTCASAYRLMLETIQDKYSHGKYAVYGIHISDGNIRLKDGLDCRPLVKQLTGVVASFAYFQVGEKRDNFSEGLFTDSLAQTMLSWQEEVSEGWVFRENTPASKGAEYSRVTQPSKVKGSSTVPEFIKPPLLVARVSTREEMTASLSRFFSDSPEPVDMDTVGRGTNG